MNKEVILGLVRHLITIIGGMVVSKGYITADDLGVYIGAVVSIIGVSWSVYEKVKRPPNPTSTVAILLLSLLAPLVFSGCKTTSDGGGFDSARLIRIARSAAEIGALLDVSKSPEHRGVWNQAATSLDVVAKNDLPTIDAIRAILLTLPIKELQSPEGRIAITAATLVWEDFVADAVEKKVPDLPQTLRDFSREVAKGIRIGLSSVPENTPRAKARAAK